MTSLERARWTFTWRNWITPRALLGAAIGLLLVIFVLGPLISILVRTLQSDENVWQQVLASRLSRNLFWLPLLNTLQIGLLVAVGTILVGGMLAWLVVLTDVPARRLIGALASVPFVLPGFATALAWLTVFRNGRLGGQAGLLVSLGLSVPDWLAWGFVPIVLILISHYYSLCYLLIAAALASVNADLLEAAEMTGASRFKVITGITLPITLPAIVAAGLLTFAEGVSNFSVPALLGLPVRYHTLSTRLYGMIQTGQQGRGYVLAILLIVVAGALLWAGNRIVSGRRSYATITGKGGRRKRITLGVWRWPMCLLALTLCTLTTIIPLLVLIASSLSMQRGSLLGSWTTHFWIGLSNPAIAQGQAGILRDPLFFRAATTTILLGLAVAIVATILGLLIGYLSAHLRTGLSSVIRQLSFLPLLIPGIALGAAFITQFGAPIGPLPALYGTFALLVIAGSVANLPYAAQSGQAAMAQVSADLEESAVMARASLSRRLWGIFLPLTIRGLSAGFVLVFVKMVRDLSLVILLFTPATPLLSVSAFRYAAEGFMQFANAVTVVIALISIGATLIAQRLQRRAQPWLQDA
jgi:iron(III) transport system permease protein